ncbi:MAG TPA: LuxR C-terminal-related transcriptional regulator [Pseudonocardiaceae bacterium]|nr:LuxR C-terminal-related transcriptional regulator [Pseudonocardiaceae bacterium]
MRALPGDGDEETYRAILVSPGLTASAIAARTGATPAAVRAAAGRLVRTGLVTATASRPATYTAHRPSTSMSGHERELEAALEEHRRAVAAFEELYSVGRSEHAHELIEVVTGKDHIARRFVHLEATAQREILVFDRPPYVLPPGHVTQRAAELELLARGVSVRCVYDRSCLDDSGGAELLTALSRAGEQIRLAADLPVKVAIFDRSAALLPLSEESGDDRVVIIRRSTMLTVLIAFFERVWREATPFLLPTEPARSDDTGRLLSLLAAGLGDAAIARQLGVSERTVGRRVRLLMDELGAASRFQAGAEAALRGLVTAEGDRQA